MSPTVERPAELDGSTRAAIRELAARVAAREGREPLSDQALTELDRADVSHTVLREGERVVGYAQRDGDAAEVVAEPTAVDAALDALLEGTAEVRLWSHGTDSTLGSALERRGASPDRRLFQLRRSSDEPVAPPEVPAGVTVDPFVVGRDEQAWLRVNAAAFAAHPEQGGWDLDDLTAREREPWFDPAGFLLAHRGEQLVGFHWTKIHPDRTGEVYVIGVDPAEQGSGLGSVLLQLGLQYLQQQGCPAVMLYVDESNAGAVRLYERRGFTRHDVDVQWTVRA